jgi:hypothetical protein
MLLLGRVADDAREPIVKVRSTLNLNTERWIRNSGMHDFGWKCRLLYLAVAGLPVCDWLQGRSCCSGGEPDYRCTARKGSFCICCGDIPTCLSLLTAFNLTCTARSAYAVNTMWYYTVTRLQSYGR